MEIKDIFDSHAHYYDKRFETEYEGGADAVLREIMPNPVSRIVNIGTNIENSKIAIEQASRYDGMYVAVGIHPEDCHYLADFDASMEELSSLLIDRHRRLHDKIVALGEIGLDYHYENYGDIPLDKKKEMQYFEAQLELAERLNLPVIIHDREAHGDCFETILKHKNLRGVFHSFSGSPELAHELIRRGWYISFSGTVTFKNATKVKEVAKSVPLDRMLVETDAPYLAPHPLRGNLNHSGLLIYTVEAIAELRGLSPEFIAEQTAENAEKFFQTAEFVQSAQKST